MAKHPKRLSALLLSSYLVLVQDLSWSDAPRQSQERVFDLFLRTTYRRSQTAPLAFDIFSFERLIPSRLPAAPVDIPHFRDLLQSVGREGLLAGIISLMATFTEVLTQLRENQPQAKYGIGLCCKNREA